MFSGSYVAIVTPMHADGAIDHQAWARLLEFHAANGTRGIVVGGTTGESATLSDAELRELVVRSREQLRGRVQLLAGAGTSSTAATVERAAWLGGLGVDALLVVTPAYNKPTQEGLYLHFAAVAAASPVPLMLYNVPGRTAVDMLPQTVARLAELPRIVAIKEAVADVGRVRELVAACGPGFDVLSGDDATAREAVLAGARGTVSVTANVAPRQMSEVMAAALAGRREAAEAADARLAALHERLFLEANPIPVKWVMHQMGLIGPGLRLPLTPLSQRFHERLREAMRAAGL
ncbi:MAG: 4-hydroxy-tetrahydrodipicolinate synthase [Steroidobacteraceae bacterium]|jgi:4-hydroxy-tetrahydrodipicolinate synthase|nr:4-hydroxy-tetrahydrodipicolinate synthase [Steroidobacteraceae bacterium]